MALEAEIRQARNGYDERDAEKVYRHARNALNELDEQSVMIEEKLQQQAEIKEGREDWLLIKQQLDLLENRLERQN